METIGDRIRKRRKELRLTQGEVGRKAGLATATISDMENGRQRETTKPLGIAQALGVRVEWLTSGEGSMLLVEGEREAAMVRDVVRHTAHGVPVTKEGALVGAEWDKIEGDEYRKLAREFIEGLVAAQKREARRRFDAGALTPSSKDRKTKGIGHNEPYPIRESDRSR